MTLAELKKYVTCGAANAARNRDSLDADKWPNSRGFQDGRVDALVEISGLLEQLTEVPK